MRWFRHRKARKFAREVARTLRYRGGRLPPGDRDAISSLLTDLQAALKAKDEAQITRAMTRLEAALAPHAAVLKRASFIEYVQSLGSAILIALFIRAFIIEAFKIPTGSMIPTLMVGDHIFVNKFIYALRIPFTNYDIVRFSVPKRGEVIVFEFPGDGEDRGKDFIKRVVAVAGDRVALRNNRLYINGKPVPTEEVSHRVSCRDESLVLCRCDIQRERQDGIEYLTQHLTPPGPADPIRCQDARPDWPTGDPRMIGGDEEGVLVPEGHVFVMGDNRDNSSDGRFWGFVPIQNVRGKAMFIWWPPGRWFRSVH